MIPPNEEISHAKETKMTENEVSTASLTKDFFFRNPSYIPVLWKELSQTATPQYECFLI